MLNFLNKILDKFGYAILKKAYVPELWDMNNPADEVFNRLYRKACPFTMTSKERMYALSQAVNYLKKNQIEGDVVECGVWRGGSSLLAALTLEELGDTSRSLYLYDTFSGMTEPTEQDLDYAGKQALEGLKGQGLSKFGDMCYASLDEVKKNMSLSNYPKQQINYVEGPVEETIPGVIPDKIALLRLDTDWFESTYHEFQHLFPKLVSGGVLIIDDYGHWRGAREATDKYFEEHSVQMLLHRIDDTARIGVKI